MKMPNMSQLMKQAQQFQAKMAKLQEELGEKTVEASAGGGMVSVVVNGRQEVLSIRIDREVIDPEDVEMLQEMVVGAVNQAMEAAGEMMNSEIEKITGGLNVPGLF